MLEETRKRGASALIYIVFGTLIAVFIINFGPQSRGNNSGCGGGGVSAPVTVGDHDVSRGSFVLMSQAFFRGTKAQRSRGAFDALIRREILAQEAEDRGMRVSEDLVDEAIKAGWIYAMLGRQSAKPEPGEKASAFFTRTGDEVFFNYKSFKNWLGQMNLTVGSYKSAQTREMLAAMMAEQIKGGVGASRDEALAEFLFEGSTVTFDAVKFSAAPYRAALRLSDADIQQFIAAHGAEIEAKYKADERLYKDTKPQLQLRWIQVAAAAAAAAPAPAPAPAPGSGSGSDSAAGSGSAAGSAAPAPAADAPDPAYDKLVAARADIEAKKKTFADVARAMNSEESDRATGGLLGWRQIEAPRLGDPALTAAIKDLQPGQMTPVIKAGKHYYLVLAEAKREGNLTFDQVKAELADDLARDYWSKEAAKRAALATLAEARGTGGKGKNLAEMFEKAESPSGAPNGLEQILNDPNLTPEQKQQLLEQFIKIQNGPQSGAIELESTDIQAKWGGEGSAAAGSASGGGGGSAPAPAPAGSAAGSAGSAAGAAAPTSPAAPTAAAPTEAAPVATSEPLPTFSTVEKPTVSRVGPVPRTKGDLPDVGTSKAIVTALFDELSPAMLGKQVYAVGDDFVVIQLADKQSPKIEEFEKDATKRIEQLRAQRAQQVLETWIKTRCDALHKSGKIKTDLTQLTEYDDKGNAQPVDYQPCEF